MSRGLVTGLRRLFVPEALGGGDPANDGALLGFDSTQPAGVKPVPSGTYVPMGTTAGGLTQSGQLFYYMAPGVVTITNPTAQGNVNYTPMPLTKAAVIDRIGIEVTTGGTAGALLRLGVYTDNGNGLPGSLLFDAGTVVATGTGWVEATVAQTLPTGLLWLACVCQGAPATPPVVRQNNGGVFVPRASAIVTSQNTLAGIGDTTATTTGALPASLTPSALQGVGSVPRVGIRVT